MLGVVWSDTFLGGEGDFTSGLIAIGRRGNVLTGLSRGSEIFRSCWRCSRGFEMESDPRLIQLRYRGSIRGGLHGSKLTIVVVVAMWNVTRENRTR